jgi:hypothetical protein
MHVLHRGASENKRGSRARATPQPSYQTPARIVYRAPKSQVSRFQVAESTPFSSALRQDHDAGRALAIAPALQHQNTTNRKHRPCIMRYSTRSLPVGRCRDDRVSAEQDAGLTSRIVCCRRKGLYSSSKSHNLRCASDFAPWGPPMLAVSVVGDHFRPLSFSASAQFSITEASALLTHLRVSQTS